MKQLKNPLSLMATKPKRTLQAFKFNDCNAL
jgi:hypothetical protein